MKYNTLSQLRKKVTPDADGDGDGNSSNETIDGSTVDFEYLYDKNGNLRFVLDPNGRKNNSYFIYYKYDAFNRRIEEGTMTNPGSNFTEANAQNTQYPTSGHTIKLAYCYNTEPAYGSGAWIDATDPGTMNNLEGHLAAAAYKDENTNGWGYTYYSYDNLGNVEWVKQDLPGDDLGIKTIAYEYDRQNNVTKLSYQDGKQDAFYIWQDYDQAGRISAIYADTTNIEPSTKVGSYTYWPTGQVRRQVLGNNVQGVDYVYHTRDWLRQINSQNLGNPENDPGGDSNDRFGEVIGYHNQDHIASDSDFTFNAQFNGNISWLVTNTATASPYLTGFTYNYDAANRLLQADYGYWLNPDWLQKPSHGYDVRDIGYDSNGNFQLLKRYGETGSVTTFDYEYYSGCNRLRNTIGSGSLNNYSYDFNGSLKGDLDQEITTVSYDYRNLPYVINLQDGSWLKYGYDATGNRVTKKFNCGTK